MLVVFLKMVNSKSIISNYKFLDCIGRGNFGDVYQGVDLRSKKVVAIKAINLEHSDDDIPVLLQEINLLRGMRHENITNWYDTIVVDVTMFIIIEYCSKGSCADLLKYNPKGLEENIVSYILQGVLKGLVYLHDNNIIHRDIKAANILISDHNIIKLADFGVSGEKIGESGRKTFVGTPYWMAPEIIRDRKYLREDFSKLERRLIENGLGRKTLYRMWNKKNKKYLGVPIEKMKIEDEDEDVEYDEKVDIWSLGVTMIELYSGKVPHSEKEPMKAIFDIPQREPPKVNGGYYMKEFGLACLCKDPYMRSSAKELLKFKFISKNKVKSLELDKVLNHTGKRRKPKFDISFQSINYGPCKDWEVREFYEDNLKGVKTDFEESKKEVLDIDLEEDTDVDSDDFDNSQEANEENEVIDLYSPSDESMIDTLANSFFDNHANINPTANTSPLIVTVSSAKISAVMKRLRDHLNGSNCNSSVSIKLSHLEYLLRDLRHRGNNSNGNENGEAIVKDVAQVLEVMTQLISGQALAV